MKYLLLTIAFLSAIQSGNCQGIPEPDFSGRPYYLVDSTLIDFERTDAKYASNAFTGETSIAVTGMNSQLHFQANQLPRVFIKLEANQDPAEIISILRIESDTDKRKKGKSGNRVFGLILLNSRTPEKRIPFTVKKVRPQLYELVFEEALTAGEYVFHPIMTPELSAALATGQAKVSCFSVK